MRYYSFLGLGLQASGGEAARPFRGFMGGLSTFFIHGSKTKPMEAPMFFARVFNTKAS